MLRSLRSWWDFARECVCFGSEAINASGEVVRGLVKSRVSVSKVGISVFGISLAASPLARSRIPPATLAKCCEAIYEIMKISRIPHSCNVSNVKLPMK